jgi:hypothetical protein
MLTPMNNDAGTPVLIVTNPAANPSGRDGEPLQVRAACEQLDYKTGRKR